MNSISDIQTRKLHVIEDIIQSQDESIISRIEAVIRRSKSELSSTTGRFTKEEMIDRMIQSEEDIRCGRIVSQENLEKQSENW
jgi:hypothetical protein